MQAQGHDNLISLSTIFGKNIVPVVASKNMQMAITDVIQFSSPSEFLRPIYAGNALQSVSVDESLGKFITVREANFEDRSMADHNGSP